MSSKPIGELTLQTLKGDNEALRKEIVTLKRQLSGYKTSNENYKMQVAKAQNYAKQFQEELGATRESLAKSEKECARIAKLCDEKASSLDNLLLIVGEKDKQIAALNSEIKAIKNDYEKLGCSYADACVDRDTYKANYKYVCTLPWYKRMFYKVK